MLIPEECQDTAWKKWGHKERCPSLADMFRKPKEALGIKREHLAPISRSLDPTYRIAPHDAVDPIPRPAGFDEWQSFYIAVIKRDLLVARPFLRKVEQAMKRATWELCVLIDYTYTAPNISLQPLSNLDKGGHPFHGGRKSVNEDRLRANGGRLTAVLTKKPSSQSVAIIETYLAHHILGEDKGTRFTYSETLQALLMSQHQDGEQAGTVVDAIRALRGSGRKPLRGKEKEKLQVLPANGVLT